MGNDAVEVVQMLQNPSGVKVHNYMCWELTKILEKIICIFPAIEAAQPGGISGIQELCTLNNTIEKAKLFLRDCAESSKLYLAVNGEATLSRCERIRKSFHQSLNHIQEMVPVSLAAKISEILNCTRDANFIIAAAEKEVGNIMLSLLAKADLTMESELEAFRFACLKLNLTSPKAFLVERRSIKKLLNKEEGTGSKREKIIKYLLYLIKKFEKQVMTGIAEQNENVQLHTSSLFPSSTSYNLIISSKQDEPADQGVTPTGFYGSNAPPEAYLCPISSQLMSDPVVIASGQTFERVCIEKWFSEGNDICPKTHVKLDNFSVLPNSTMKDLIVQWHRKHDLLLSDPYTRPEPAEFSQWENSSSSSMTSLKNVSALLLDGKRGDYIVNGDHSNISFTSSDTSYCSDSSYVKNMERFSGNPTYLFSLNDAHSRLNAADFREDTFLKFFYELLELPLETQAKKKEEIKSLPHNDHETCTSMLSNGFLVALIGFLKHACAVSDVKAQKLGAEILLAFFSNCRFDLSEDAYCTLTSLLESGIAEEALMILEKVPCHQNCTRENIASSGILQSVLRFLDSRGSEFLNLALRVLSNFSSVGEMRHHIVSSGLISKLVPLLGNRMLAKNCIKIMRNLCDFEEAGALIASTEGCIASISELLEDGSQEEQEDAVVVLNALCFDSFGNFQMIMHEGVIPALVTMSANGSTKGKEVSLQLLRTLRDHSHQIQEDSESLPVSDDASKHSQSSPKLIRGYIDDSITSQTSNDFLEDQANISSKIKSTSRSSFFSRKLKFLSRPKSMA